MSLKNKYKTSADKANSGVWFDYPDCPNADGTIPGFLMARKNNQNKEYSRAIRAFTKDHTSDDGEMDISGLSDEEAAEADLSVFVSSLLLDWRNFQPEDDGKEMKYTKEDARVIFGDPDWSDFYKDLLKKCTRGTAYKEKQLKAEAKNS